MIHNGILLCLSIIMNWTVLSLQPILLASCVWIRNLKWVHVVLRGGDACGSQGRVTKGCFRALCCTISTVQQRGSLGQLGCSSCSLAWVPGSLHTLCHLFSYRLPALWTRCLPCLLQEHRTLEEQLSSLLIPKPPLQITCRLLLTQQLLCWWDFLPLSTLKHEGSWFMTWRDDLQDQVFELESAALTTLWVCSSGSLLETHKATTEF